MAGETTVTGTVVAGNHDTSATIIQGVHDNSAQGPLLGAGVFGLPTNGSWVFTIPDLPQHSKVTDARVTFTAASTSTVGSYETEFSFIARDGKWNKDFFDGWSLIPTVDFKALVFDTGATQQINTLVFGPNILFPLRGISSGNPLYTQLGQSITNETGSDFTLGTVRLVLQKFGTPTGEVGLEIYQAEAGTDLMIEGADPLARSDDVDVSTIGSKFGYNFEFTGDDQINWADDNQFVVVLSGNYTHSASDRIVWWGRQNGTGSQYTGGIASTSGIGFHFDAQNYPDQQSVPTTEARLGSIHGHTFLQFSFAGQERTAGGGMAIIVQEAINDTQYEADGNIICLNWGSNNATALEQRAIAMFENPTYSAPTLEVKFIPRRIITVM